MICKCLFIRPICISYSRYVSRLLYGLDFSAYGLVGPILIVNGPASPSSSSSHKSTSENSPRTRQKSTTRNSLASTCFVAKISCLFIDSLSCPSRSTASSRMWKLHCSFCWVRHWLLEPLNLVLQGKLMKFQF